MEYREEDLLGAIKESFLQYLEFGERSTKKLKPLHGYIGKVAQSIWGEDFEYNYISFESLEQTYLSRNKPRTRIVNRKEKVVEGEYYNKSIDVCVSDKSVPVCCIGIKFVTSNYGQNANNYFENMMGETANIQRRNIPYFQIQILRDPVPYFKKSRVIERWDNISNHDLQKYLKLANDRDFPHRPTMGIILVNVNQETGKTFKVVEGAKLSKVELELLYSSLSIHELFAAIEKYKCIYLLTKNNGESR